MNAYLFLKLIHIFAVIIFMGNIITGLFWMRMADKTNDFRIISFTMKGIIKSDQWFTIPGVIIITAGGIAAAIQGGLPLLRTGWIFWSIIMFIISGIVFSVKLAPLQKKIHHLAEKNKTENSHLAMYRSSLKQWEQWGLVAVLTPIAAMIMMVLKMPVSSGF